MKAEKQKEEKLERAVVRTLLHEENLSDERIKADRDAKRKLEEKLRSQTEGITNNLSKISLN
jgi:phosphopantetheinyl transferase